MNDAAATPAPQAAPDPTLCPACKKPHAGTDAATLRALAATPARLDLLLKGLDAAGWKESYGTDKWTIREIVCHMRDCEIVFGTRWRTIVSEDQPKLAPFDQDRWEAHTHYAKQDAKQALATLKLLRASNLEMLKLAGKAALARVGVHGDYGPITVAQVARHVLAHDRNHVAQIEQARADSRKARQKPKATNPSKRAKTPKKSTAARR